jgi:hypothetical protein
MTDELQLDFDPTAQIVAHADEVLAGASGPWPLPAGYAPLLAALLRHRGAASPIAIAELTTFLPLNEREIKAAVKSLVEDFNVPIGASRGKPCGYFLILTAEDVALALRPLVKELRSISRRARVLGGRRRLNELLGQIQIEMKDDPKEAA